MGIKSALFQNFYMDFNEVIEAGERIRSVMSAVDGCMEEADGLFCRISALAGNVPAKARCGVLLSACEQARAGIKKADFLAYGNRVSRNMFELADYSEYVSNETIRRMEDIRERLGGIRNTVAGLNELLEFRVYKSNPSKIQGSMKHTARNNDTMGNGNRKKTLQELREIYGQEYEEDLEYELTTSYLAARLAKIDVDRNGQPGINSGVEYLAYAECCRKIESGIYSNSYIAAKLAGLSVSEKGEPSINSAAESNKYFYYLDRIKQTQYQEVGYTNSTAELIKRYESIWGTVVQTGDTYSIGWGCDFTKESDPDLYEKYVIHGECITDEDADKLFDKKVIQYCQVVDELMEDYNITFNQNQYDALTSFIYNNGIHVFSEENYTSGIAEGGKVAERAEARGQLLNYLISNNGNYDDQEIVRLFVNCGGPNLDERFINGYRNRREGEANYFNGGDTE